MEGAAGAEIPICCRRVRDPRLDRYVPILLIAARVARGWIERSRDASGSSHALNGMRDWVGAVGGTVDIVSSPGQGSTVQGTIPVSGTG